MKLKNVFWCIIATLICCGSVGADPVNLINNPGFENGATSWSIPDNTATVVDSAAHSGRHSLYYENKSAGQYKIFKQRLDVQPGQMIRLSAWVKGENVTHKNGDSKQGAGIFVQSSNAKGQVRAGRFPQTLSGTFDWQQVQTEYLVYDKAVNTTFGLYLRQGVTGKVWFDDIEVTIVPDDPLELFLKYPNYRGMITEGNRMPWKFAVRFIDVPEGKVKTATVNTVLSDEQGKVLLERDDIVTPANPEITFQPPAPLKLGNYLLKQSVRADGFTLNQENKIQVVDKMPLVHVDAQGFTVVNGERFFPLGLYLGPTSDEDLQRIAEGGFNTILAYGYGSGKDPAAFMDRAEKHQLKVIYSLKDMYSAEQLKKAPSYIKQMRDKPALLSWYINDELGTEWLPQLNVMYDHVTQGDPNHPAYQVLNRADFLEKYFWTTDTFGMDSYPVGAVNLSQISSRSQRSIEAAMGAKSVWMVTQIYDKAAYDDIPSRQPTLDEMRNQAYQALIHGASGLLFYSYFDLSRNRLPRNKATLDPELFKRRWPEVAAMGQEIKQLIPTILHGQEVPLEIDAQELVQVKAIEYNDELFILLANPYYESKQISIEIPQKYHVSKEQQGAIEGYRRNEKIIFELPSVASGVFRLACK